MYAIRSYYVEHGKLVEQGSVRQIFLAPQQPYTQRLIGAIPLLQPPQRLPETVLATESAPR